MIWGFCVYFVYMIPLETDVLRKHRFQKSFWLPDCLIFSVHSWQGDFPQFLKDLPAPLLNLRRVGVIFFIYKPRKKYSKI